MEYMPNQHIQDKPTLIQSIRRRELERQSLQQTNSFTLTINPIDLHKSMKEIVEIPSRHVCSKGFRILWTK